MDQSKCPHEVLLYWGSARFPRRGDGVICKECGCKWKRTRERDHSGKMVAVLNAMEVVKIRARILEVTS